MLAISSLQCKETVFSETLKIPYFCFFITSVEGCTKIFKRFCVLYDGLEKPGKNVLMKSGKGGSGLLKVQHFHVFRGRLRQRLLTHPAEEWFSFV